MIITTTDKIAYRKIKETLGVVRGNTIRARHIGNDILAMLRNLIGGEVKEYTGMISEAREEAFERMNQEAEELEADAILNVRFTTSQVMGGAAEILAYGTAVKLERRE
ncbi:YbjQ family protein [Acetohalobium arabaticum]|uniref:UPF0145 protein Acear_1659 n=1 Tax=Acetohalobium arabaticum (strain ATCC 49924 / DSM 5501 / Z-7288) TaxID=574087 RepID=D9QRM3_ACEAZ|nr:YbjQ family protein [Acetohalobium arabaticum]ADL13164.1 protein of unknown function DUF74 [Acetohalobium arabaticum DSM 5501]